ncbi:hypothetical protein ILUMI_03459 [Ignelater luminosus]|uniref:PiggyBac transposable element-derived protein domain-containing protein n=1 Tax=Ignelater luminosus TaxID=2038154 RepID=A0A8K0DEL2_IGNLU|nr:hypothetical protein ILUMI_03459 [Ignelater luminosus]
MGTLKKNRKLNPKEVLDAKLKKGKIIGMQNNTDVIVTKWKYKRVVLMLSTKHTAEMVDVHQRREVAQKPALVVDYNKSKGFIDIYDHIKFYFTASWKLVKWYRKITIELLLGSATVNAYIVHQIVTNNNKIFITSLKEELIGQPIDFSRLTILEQQMLRTRESRHLEVQSSARGRCITCYAKRSAQTRTPFLISNSLSAINSTVLLVLARFMYAT